jgi:hypothetical protein
VAQGSSLASCTAGYNAVDALLDLPFNERSVGIFVYSTIFEWGYQSSECAAKTHHFLPFRCSKVDRKRKMNSG